MLCSSLTLFFSSPFPDLRRLCSCPGGPHPASSSWVPRHGHVRHGVPGTDSGCSSGHLSDGLGCGHYQPDPGADPDPVFGDSSVPR